LISAATSSTGGGAVRYFSSNELVCTVDDLTGSIRVIAAGKCEISAKVSATDVHDSAITTVNIEITISRAPLVVTASSATIFKDPGGYPVTYSFSEFQHSETEKVLTALPKCTSDYFFRVGAFDEDDDDEQKVLTYKTSCSGVVASNYDISYVGGVLTHIRRDD
jgi:hypothetical protein